ncbi:unnamed protein product [Cylicocyclus nassatus]|uniref:Uncharacterized protein n=1 Tax=Cylicocyclus nassatus TaxID=53992 RepID=A0AA36GRB1_CYLNA|nr:unnamed protein product [Cylicocyclus nassatus]
MRDLDEVDVYELEMTDDADSDEEAMGEKCINLLSSLLPSGSCIYSLRQSISYQLTPSEPKEDQQEPLPSLSILSSAEEVVANCAASGGTPTEERLEDFGLEALPPPEEHTEPVEQEPKELEEVRFVDIFSVCQMIQPDL